MIKAKEALLKLSPNHNYKSRPLEEIMRGINSAGERDTHLRYRNDWFLG